MYKDAFDHTKDANQAEARFIIKRSGKQVPYEPVKIKNAISKANKEEMRLDKRLTEDQITEIAEIVTSQIYKKARALGVEEIQDIVEEEICKRSYSVFLLYHDYRHLHQEKRKMTELGRQDPGDRGNNEKCRRFRVGTERGSKAGELQ